MRNQNRRKFIQQSAFLTGSVLATGLGFASPGYQKSSGSLTNFRFRLLRHASLVLEINGLTILVDPMLSKKETMDPVTNAANSSRIPMVDLPINAEELKQLLQKTDAILLTHTHRDHWDAAAQLLLDKKIPVFCQPADETKIRQQGFIRVTAIEINTNWNNIRIHRTGGQHGTGDIGKAMGTVSGFVVSYADRSLYITGDTIWCSDVQHAIAEYKPTHIIVNGGGARFLTGDPITMTATDVTQVCRATASPVTVVHLDTINHCLEKREVFRELAKKEKLNDRLRIPEDGEWIAL